MIITKEMLEAKRKEYLEAIEQSKATLNANYGALQVVEELLGVINAPQPNDEKASKK